MSERRQAPPSRGQKVYIDGRTPAGTHVLVYEGTGGYGTRFEVYIDGERVDYSSASRARDGGTTKIHTERGYIFVYRRMGAEPYAELDGKRLS